MKRRQKQTLFNNINNLKKEANMNFEELHNITKNFCNTHSFEAFGEPIFDYDHQCYNHDLRSTFYNSLCDAAFENEKLTKILVRLTEKEILNNEEILTIHILRMIENLTEKHDKYVYESSKYRAKSYEGTVKLSEV